MGGISKRHISGADDRLVVGVGGAVPVRVLWCWVFSTLPACGGLERVWCRGGAGSVDTLLGPEATGLSCTVVCGGCCFVCSLPLEGLHGLCGLDGGVGLLFENCIVDASIYRQASYRDLFGGCGAGVCLGFCVAKFLRAHGECLGIRSR